MSTQQHNEYFDVVVIGCGPGGSTLAAYLARAGVSALALEKEAFPRYHIGESLTGMAANVINDFGLGPEMTRRQFPPKGGVKVIGREARNEFFVPVLQPTWQVRRDEFDQMLLENAVSNGATHRYGVVTEIIREGDRVVGLNYLPAGQSDAPPQRINCRVVADASGRAAILSRQGIAGPLAYYDEFARQVAIFTQFKDARRDPGEMGDNTFLFYSEAHHWAWFIPLSPDVVSVGVVLPGEKVKQRGGSESALAWALEELNPELRWRVTDCAQVEPVRAITNYSYSVDPFVGDGWLCIGDAHRFTDPIFSFGASFAMVEARAASQAILTALGTGNCAEPFADYADFCNRGQNAARDVIRYFWKFPIFFGYQSRSELRHDLIRLLGSDCHSLSEMRALQVMRNALKKFGVEKPALAQPALCAA